MGGSENLRHNFAEKQNRFGDLSYYDTHIFKEIHTGFLLISLKSSNYFGARTFPPSGPNFST